MFPATLRFVPKPGAWMEAFKQFMGFLLMATVIFLVYVFGARGRRRTWFPWLLFALLLTGHVAAWIYGRWANPNNDAGTRIVSVVLALVFLFGVSFPGHCPCTDNSHFSFRSILRPMAEDQDWQPWSDADS